MPDGYHSSNDSNPGDQRRNLLIFASCVALQYLAAPVIYVGITQAALLKQLGANTRLGIPGTVQERADRVVAENLQP